MSTKRIPMVLRLQQQTFDREWPCRAVRETDAQDLAILMYASFRGTIDDEGETFANAVREIEKTLIGDYGKLLLECSFVIEEGELLASACLISWFDLHEAPLVVFTMTRPEHKGQGMARFLLQRSINSLIDQGYSQLTLIVTDGNRPAQDLYVSLGFREMSSKQSLNPR